MTLLSSRPAVVFAWAVFVIPAAGIAVYSFVLYLTFDHTRTPVPLNAAVPSHFLWIVMHALPASVALLLGPIQLIPGLRLARLRLHRILGRIYAASVAIGSVTGFVAAVISNSGFAVQVGLGLLVLAWAFTLWKGYSAARARRIPEHRLWMFRNVALTYAAVLLRVFLGFGHLLAEVWPAIPFRDLYTASLWAAVLIAVVVSDWVFVASGTSRRQ